MGSAWINESRSHFLLKYLHLLTESHGPVMTEQGSESGLSIFGENRDVRVVFIPGGESDSTVIAGRLSDRDPDVVSPPA